jgi:hypothetical protein
VTTSSSQTAATPSPSFGEGEATGNIQAIDIVQAVYAFEQYFLDIVSFGKYYCNRLVIFYFICLFGHWMYGSNLPRDACE